MTGLLRWLVSTLLGILVVLAVVMPVLMRKQNIQPTLARARAVVKQTQIRDRAMEDFDVDQAVGLSSSGSLAPGESLQNDPTVAAMAAVAASAVALPATSTGDESSPESVLLPEALALQQATKDALATGGRDPAKLRAVEEKARAYNKARLELAD